MLPDTSIKKSTRVLDIDFWRGFALVVIVIDHVPGSFLDKFTLMNFGFSDAAEVFVFLSGVSIGLVYLPRFQQGGFRGVLNGCWTRAFKLYGVHIALTAVALLILVIVVTVVANVKPIASPEQCHASRPKKGSLISSGYRPYPHFATLRCSGINPPGFPYCHFTSP